LEDAVGGHPNRWKLEVEKRTVRVSPKALVYAKRRSQNRDKIITNQVISSVNALDASKSTYEGYGKA